MTKSMQIGHFLSEECTAEIEQCVSRLVHDNASDFVGRWDKTTGFCVVVEVIAGRPYQWHVRGPLTVEGARLWLAFVESEITAPAMHANESDARSVH